MPVVEVSSQEVPAVLHKSPHSRFSTLTSGLLALLFSSSAAWAGVGISELSITKTDGAGVSAIGGSITYTIVGTNAGPDDVFGATVTDNFPSDLTCTWTCSASAGSSCAGSGSGNISDSVNLLENGTATYTANCSISSAASPGTLVNTASITSAATDGTPGDNTATDTNSLWPVADLAITKTDGVTAAAPGDSLTYTIVASNNGPMASFGATVSDTFPSDLTCTWTCTASAGSTCTGSGSGNISDSVSLLSGGTATYMASCSIALAATGTLSNTATISGMVVDGTPGNDSATDGDTVLSPSTDLSVALADSPDPVVAGTSLTYTATVTNNGPSNSTGASLTSAVPAGTSFSSSADCTEAGGTVTCAIGAMAPSASDMVSWTVIVDPARTAAITASATAAANETDPVAGNNTGAASTTVTASTDLSVALADSPDPVTAGNTLTYTATVTNNGPSSSTGSTVTSAVPAGTSFSSSADCTESGGTVTCAIGALASSANDMVSWTVTVDSDRTTAVNASATVAADETDGTAGNNTAAASTAVDVETDLSVSLADAPDPVTAGNTLTYTATVTHNGPSDSTGATLTSAVPAGTTFSSSADCTESGGTVTCAVGALAPSGSDMVSWTVTVDAGRTAAVTASATVAANETDSTAANDTSAANTTVAAETDLSIALADSPDPVVAGTNLTYTATVTNNGPSNSTGSTVTSAVPAGTTFSSSADCTESLGTVTCAVGALASLASDMVSWTVTVDADRTAAVTASATVAANETDSTAANNTSAASTTVSVEFDLSISMTDSADPVGPGAAFSYLITVDNAGPSDAAGVNVIDTLPSGVTLLSTSGCNEDPSAAPLCTLGTVAVGGMVSYQINVSAPGTAGMITNSAVVSGVGTDTNGLDNTVDETTTITPSAFSADVSITKDDGVTEAAPGSTVTYTIVAANAGPDDALGATVTDVFSAILDCDWTCVPSAGSTCTGAGSGDLSDTVDLLASGTATYTAVCLIDAGATGSLTNSATVTTPTSDPNPGNEVAMDTDTLTPSADLSVGVVTSPTPVELGEPVTVTVTVENEGPSDSQGVVVTTTLPAGLTFDGTSGCVEDPSGVPTCTLGSLSAGSVATFSIAARATGESSTGSLSVSSVTPDPNGINDGAAPEVVIGQAVIDVPVADGLGLFLLVLLLSTAGLWVLRLRG